jgi:Fe-S oxidoreductase
MNTFDDSLRGYGFRIHQRDNFTCRFCGADGTQSFDTWLTLSCDHLLPKGHPERENPDYIVTACNFCNTADNRYFDHATERGLEFDGKTPDELVAQRWRYVQAVRQRYREFWEEKVQNGPA